MLIACLLMATTGCSMISKLGTDTRGESLGKIYYLGGAGVFGHVGTTSVPRGLRAGGWPGAVEVFGWQSNLGGTIRDQMDAARNRKEAQLLRNSIVAYQDRYPGRPVHIIALSAGTGVAVWAVADLPEKYPIQHMVLLSSSLSADYNLGQVLANMTGELWNIYNPTDEVLRLGVPMTGSVDRQFSFSNFAGVVGFKLPINAWPALEEAYRSRVLNLPWEPDFANYGYNGRHAQPVNKSFIQHVVTPLMLRQPLSELLFDDPLAQPEPTERNRTPLPTTESQPFTEPPPADQSPSKQPTLDRFDPNSPPLEPINPNDSEPLQPR